MEKWTFFESTSLAYARRWTSIQEQMQMEWEGGTTAEMETTPAEAVNSPLMASGVSTVAYFSMSSCGSKKRGMNQVTNYKDHS